MLARLELQLNTDTLDYSILPKLHGVLFSKIPSDYADKIHSSQIKPFSTGLIKRQNHTYWAINTLNSEAYENIILPLLEYNFSTLHLSGSKKPLEIISQKITEQTTYDHLWEKSCDKADKYVRLNFKTPTAFKSNGSYYILPVTRFIFNSLNKKMSEFNSAYNSRNLDFNSIDSQVLVNSYSLNSSIFRVDAQNIKGFTGAVELYCSLPLEHRQVIFLLCNFAEYSGIGIKSPLGMGQISIKL